MKQEPNHNRPVRAKSVAGWTTKTALDIGVLLSLHCADARTDSGTGQHAVEVVLTAQQCLELARTLTREANKVLDKAILSEAELAVEFDDRDDSSWSPFASCDETEIETRD